MEVFYDTYSVLSVSVQKCM